MKKLLFACAGLMLLSTSMNAQSKEELKAEKAAIKEAESLVKKARQNYEMGIPNAQYGRKETNFAKIDEAKALIEQAIDNKYVVNNPETWKVAADIMGEYYNKYDALGKENEADKVTASEYAYRLSTYAIKYDSLIFADPKKKDVEKTFINEQYRNKATNPLLGCLQVAQNLSNSDNQEDFKKGKKYAGLIVNALGSSHLFSTFQHESKNDWITYAKAFYAQSVAGLETSKPEEVEAAYKQLYGTQYEAVAYSALINYYREKDKAKFSEILSYAADNAKDDNAPQFNFMYIQSLYQDGKKADCIKQIDKFMDKFASNENAVNALLMKGQIFFEDKKYDEAEKVFAIAAEKYPEEERAITMPAKCAWMKAQTSGTKADRDYALKLFKELEAKYPDNPDFWGEPLYILYNNSNLIKERDKYKKYYKPL